MHASEIYFILTFKWLLGLIVFYAIRSNQTKNIHISSHLINSHENSSNIIISDENTSQNQSVSPNHSLSSMNHHHQYQINHHHNNDHRPSVSSLTSTNETNSTPFTTQNHDPLFKLGSIMSPAAYTNAPTSCGLELSYGASNACQPQYHNHYALSSPSLSSVAMNPQKLSQPPPPPPLTSESTDGCNNIMRIIDQTFRDNPDIFTDNYLKRFQSENNTSREYSCTNYRVPGTSSISGETIVSRDVTMTLKFDENDDKKVPSTSCSKQGKCDCVKKSYSGTKCKEESSWQLIEANDCKMIQQRIEYFESFCPDADPEMNSKAMFLYKENKIISGDGGVNRKNEIKLEKSTKHQAICSDSHDSGYANASNNSLNREKSACSDCCYCNPLLHSDPNNKAESCVYCRNKTPNVDQETIPDTPCSMHGYYETMKKSNHVHTRIKSRESDTVSVKCTKTNERIKRSCCQSDCSASFQEKPERTERKVDPKGSKAGGHLSRPKDINNILRTTNVQKVEKEIHDKISRSPKSSKHHAITKQSLIKDSKPKEIRLPSPYKCISSNSYESTSDSSCSLNCSPTKKTTLPQAHWQQQHHNFPLKAKNHTIKAKTVTNTLPRTSRADSHLLYHHAPTAATTPEHKLTNANKNLHDSHEYVENLDITNANHQHHYDHYNQQTNMNHNNNNENENNVNNIDSDTQYNNFVNNNDNNCTSPNIITTCHTTTNNVNTNGNNMTTTAGK